MASNVIELRNVSFAYNSTPILEDVCLEVPLRDFACMVGPNGGGKTTLLKLILGLLTPARGQIRVFGGTVIPMDDLAKDYVANMESIAEKIRKALGGTH